jgi:calcineurin-like phosphoesterase family protein
VDEPPGEPPTPKILAVSDEVDETLDGSGLDEIRPDIVVSCGDLPLDYLQYLITRLNVPLVYVPGNHDPDLGERRAMAWSPMPLLRHRESPPGPPGGINADLRVVDAVGLRLAGLGGSVRYREGPNQYTQVEMRRRARLLRLRIRAKRFRDGRGLDVLVTHAPPFGLGDDDDPAHVGIEALNWLVEHLSPSLLLHGHIHPYGEAKPDRLIGSTRVVNVIPRRVLEVGP